MCLLENWKHTLNFLTCFKTSTISFKLQFEKKGSLKKSVKFVYPFLFRSGGSLELTMSVTADF